MSLTQGGPSPKNIAGEQSQLWLKISDLQVQLLRNAARIHIWCENRAKSWMLNLSLLVGRAVGSQGLRGLSSVATVIWVTDNVASAWDFYSLWGPLDRWAGFDLQNMVFYMVWNITKSRTRSCMNQWWWCWWCLTCPVVHYQPFRTLRSFPCEIEYSVM